MQSSAFNRRQLLTIAAKATAAGAAMSLLPLARTVADETARPRFKYAMCNETFGDWPFEKAFALVAECGYKGIEMAPFTMALNVTEIPAKRRREVRRLAERNGLDVIGLHWLLAKTTGLHLTTADADVRRKTSVYLGELARFCADLGGKIMVLGSPQQRNLTGGMTKEVGMQHAAEVLRAAMPAMEKAGVVVAIEPLGPADGNFLLTAADGAALAEMVGSPHCRLHLDCKAMASEPTPIPELIRKYRDVMVHFHANDPNLQGPGFGKLDFVPIMKALADINYRGWVSVEVFDYKPGPERLTRESITYMQNCVAKLGAQKW